MKKKTWRAGSCTIEASLLMGILLPLLAAIIYMGFFLHDRGFLQGAAYEAAVYASLHADDQKGDAADAAQKLIAGRMLGTQNVSVNAGQDQKKVQVVYEGSFAVPHLAQIFFGSARFPVKALASLTLERPSRRIQTIRGLAKVFNSIRRKRE